LRLSKFTLDFLLPFFFHARYYNLAGYTGIIQPQKGEKYHEKYTINIYCANRF
jgi:hypothetical protein